MRLKTVELYGFKSFAQKTVLRFDDDFVAIVGPNGSGKSNFSDAVRWVLGETSAKALRGSKMEDIIFAGTDQKKAMNMAEVSLVFDNADGQLALPYDEVVVSRKMYRNGESEYTINRQTVRRKDVYELFFDTGIGKEGYSLIGQGRIDEILRAKGEDRRAVFEEAAGISKFKFKKTEALRRLSKTEQQLDELKLEMKGQEAEARVLKQQAENAQQGMALLKTLEQHELSFLQAGLSHDREELQKIDAEADKNRAEQENWAQQKAQVDGALEPLQAFMSTYEADEKRVSTEIAQWERRIEQEQMAESAAEEKLHFYAENARRLAEAAARDEARGAALQEEIARATADEAKAVAAFERLERQAVVADEAEADDAADADYAAAQQRVHEAQEALTVLSVREEQQRAQQESDEDLRQQARGELQSLQAKRNAIDQAQAERQEALSQAEKKLRDISETLAAWEKRKRNLEEAEADTRQQRAKAVEMRAGVASRGRVLQSLRDQYEGYQRAVQLLMNLAKQDASVKARIVGPLGELVTVKKGFETAVEVALGGAMQNIVVPDERDAKALIALLKEKRWGRVTFLPLDRIRGQKPVKLKRPQELCQGLEALEYDPSLENVLSHFLARTSFVRTIDDALALSHQTSQNRLVTLDGEVINTWGSMVGGTNRRASEGTIFSRENELAEAKQKAKELQKVIQETDDTLASILKEDEAMEAQRASLNAELEDARVSVAALREAIAVAAVTIQETERDVLRMEEALSSKTGDVVDFATLKAQAEDALQEAQAAFQQQTDARNERMKRQAVRAEQKRHEESERRQVEQTKNALTARVRQLQEQWDDLLSQDAERKRQQAEADAVIAHNQKQIEESRKAHSEALAKRQELNETLAKLQEENREKRKRVEDLIEKQREAEATLQQLESAKEKLLWRRESLETRQKERLESYAGQYDLSLEMIRARLARLEYVPTTQKQINDIKQQLSQIGYFNVETIEQYRELSDAIAFLQGQMDDLSKSKADIEDLIRELDQTMILQFREMFDQINASYDRIFRILFRGGQASLKLEGDDVLTAGIEIEAQPPGKKRQNLDLLSGGERSMTALALLFALFSIRPTPFCILDEIDASLDEANIGRYVDYLKTLRDETQFIVITHRKTTMQLAQTLYGVTMQDGVSQVVFLRFSDVEAEKLAQAQQA
ncbi:MAG: chromosome segregation protein SMC [Peptoniphilaceae bacterium]|nr:chromosome segregation protein SMC [Peptoniphilaceae bacterium]MDY6085568.1 chromosome segregation protein SMC [Peptoniphilaceae bacterium]